MSRALLSVKNDYVFKRVFGNPNNIDALADLLQAVLDIPKEDYGRLDIVDPHTGRRRPDDKLSILDVRIHTASGKIIDIEIQVNREVAFKERIVYYTSILLTDQMERGLKYDVIKKVISIIITDFTLIDDSDAYHNRYLLCDPKTGSRFGDIFEINTLELSKLPKESDGGALWNWLKLMTVREEEDMAELAKKSVAIGKVTACIKEMSEDEAERMIAEAREKERRDRWAEIEYGRQEGLRQGIDIGKEAGRHEKSLEIADRMKRQNIPSEIITSVTDLSAEEIAEL
ncbi:MAG: Rpn family recombination-promoting nuclease/putative transposase [Clostridiales Family XIII bacterium]|jgi:predicted transposase/invertase (TIGR01784 family)|nr:Rpn family recombination-promoting nuclease/putative transposase [Clostridiales Family XIII bacterium]